MKDDARTPVAAARSARLARLAGVVSLGLAAALGGAWFYRLPLGEALIKHNLGMSGVPADLRMERLDFSGATIKAIKLGPAEAPDLWIETARVDLDWRAGLPRIGAVALDKGWLRARLDERGLSLGALDKLGGGEPLRDKPKIPDWAIKIRAFRLISVTPIGRFDANVNASGRLHDDFRGTVDVPATDLIGPKGGAEAFEAHVVIVTDARQQLAGTIEAKAETIAWRPRQDEAAAELSGALLSAGFVAPFDLRGATARMEARLDRAFAPDAFDVNQGAMRADAAFESFQPGFKPSRFRGSYEIRLDRSALAGARFARATLKGPLMGDYTDEIGKLSASGALETHETALDAQTRRAVLNAIPDLGGTPFGPLIAASERGLDRALTRFDLNASLVAAQAGDNAGLGIGQGATLTAANGAMISVHPLEDDPLTMALPSGDVSGGVILAMRGGALPDAQAPVTISRKGAALLADAQLTIRKWTAGGAALTTSDARVSVRSGGRSGKASVRGAAKITGPLAGLRLVEADTPLALDISWGEGLRVESTNGCIAIDAAAIEGPGMIFGRSAATVCPLGAALFASDKDGRLSGGFALNPLAWRGKMTGKSGEPARLATGRIEGSFSGTMKDLVLAISAPGVDFAADYPQQRHLRVRADAVTARLLSSGGGWSIAGAIQNADVRDTSLPGQLTAFNGAWSGAPRGDGQAVFRVEQGRGRLFDPADKALYHPIVVSGVSAVLEDGLVRAQGDLALEEKPIALGAFVATHNVETGVGEMRADARDLTFSAALQPYDISELARGIVDNVRGPIDVAMRANWTPDAASTGATATIKTLNLDSSSLGPVQGLSGVVEIDDLAKMTTPPGQKLAVKMMNPGVTVENGEISFQLRENMHVAIESAKWPFAKGVLAVDPTTIDIAGEETRLVLTLTDVDVGALTEALNFKGLAATGQVQGRFPLIFTKTSGRIEGGALHASPGGGTIAYRSEAPVAGAAGIAFDALRTFRYDNLSLELSGPLDGEVVSAINFTGVNREPVDPGGSIVPMRVVGIPFKFNVTVRAPFMALAQSAAGFADARRYLEEADADVEAEVEPAPPDAEQPAAK